MRREMRAGTILPSTLTGAARKVVWDLDGLESQNRGLLHFHRLDAYPGPMWSRATIDEIIWGHYPTDEEEAYFHSLYSVPLLHFDLPCAVPLEHRWHTSTWAALAKHDALALLNRFFIWLRIFLSLCASLARQSLDSYSECCHRL